MSALRSERVAERTPLLREQGIAGSNPVIPFTNFHLALFWVAQIGLYAKFFLTLK